MYWKRFPSKTHAVGRAYQVKSSTVDSPELIRKQLRPAVPKPDTPRPAPRSGSKGGGSAAASGSIQETLPEGDDISNAAAAAVLASGGEEKKSAEEGGRYEGQANDGDDGDRAGEGARTTQR